jgi:hypothetical protein
LTQCFREDAGDVIEAALKHSLLPIIKTWRGIDWKRRIGVRGPCSIRPSFSTTMRRNPPSEKEKHVR